MPLQRHKEENKMAECKKCGKKLKANEISLYKRVIDPNSDSFLCLDCMAEYFRCTTEFLNKKIAYFKSIGCELFNPD